MKFFKSFTIATFTAVLILQSATSIRAQKFAVEKTDDGVIVRLDGKLFTQHLTKSGAKPVFWPVIGASGSELTRSYPIVKEGKPTERKDHIHHRSFWFTHGDVNGVSFWHENDRHGNIVQRRLVEASGGESALIHTLNDWVSPDGERLCEDERIFTFGANKQSRWIDTEITVTAVAKQVVFGDTKEGSFGVRVAGTMKVDSELGGKIINSEGQTDKDAWGKPAKWVDYHGPVEGKVEGIAILNHPSSYGFPSHWHVRTYGLFTANPFGLNAFYNKQADKDGTLTMKREETFTLKYRVLFHPGDETQGGVEASYKQYTK